MEIRNCRVCRQPFAARVDGEDTCLKCAERQKEIDQAIAKRMKEYMSTGGINRRMAVTSATAEQLMDMTRAIHRLASAIEGQNKAGKRETGPEEDWVRAGVLNGSINAASALVALQREDLIPLLIQGMRVRIKRKEDKQDG